MHIPQAMLQGTVCPVTAVLGAGVIAAAVVGVLKEKGPGRCTPMNFALVSALVFAAQMLNFPVAGGTSGHLLGGVLAVSLLGLPHGVLALALTVSLQCLFFADGGLDMLGANILNMAGIGAGIGGLLLYLSRHYRIHRYAALFIAAWCSVVLASLAVAVELAAAGTIPLGRVLPAMVGIHMLIGLGEGAITVAAAAFITLPEAQEAQSSRKALLICLAAAALLSPFACGFPDGLEWVAEQLGFMKEAAPMFAAPMPDYAIPALSAGLASQWLAATVGIAITFAIAAAVAMLLRRKATVGDSV